MSDAAWWNLEEPHPFRGQSGWNSMFWMQNEQQQRACDFRKAENVPSIIPVVLGCFGSGAAQSSDSNLLLLLLLLLRLLIT